MKSIYDTFFLFRGAGDIATGAILRLKNAGMRRIACLEVAEPSAVRISFSEAVYDETKTIEGVTSLHVQSCQEFSAAWEKGLIPILIDPDGSSLAEMRATPSLPSPDVEVEITLAKHNIGIHKDDAPLVIAVGPGYEAGKDAHCVIESLRGVDLGRVLYAGCASANTGAPEKVYAPTGCAYDLQRVLRIPVDGRFTSDLKRGAMVKAGDAVAEVLTLDGIKVPVLSQIDGMVRGLLHSPMLVTTGMKAGDIEPRPGVSPDAMSDKGFSIGGAILEAVLAQGAKAV